MAGRFFTVWATREANAPLLPGPRAGPCHCLCLQWCVWHWIQSQETDSHYLPPNCSLERYLKGVSCKKYIEFKSDQASRSSYQFEGIIWVLLLLSRFSRVRLCATPETAAHQAPPSLVFSRQEHWSGLPFPSPMHESEKWKWSRSVVSDS